MSGLFWGYQRASWAVWLIPCLTLKSVWPIPWFKMVSVLFQGPDVWLILSDLLCFPHGRPSRPIYIQQLIVTSSKIFHIRPSNLQDITKRVETLSFIAVVQKWLSWMKKNLIRLCSQATDASFKRYAKLPMLTTKVWYEIWNIDKCVWTIVCNTYNIQYTGASNEKFLKNLGRWNTV